MKNKKILMIGVGLLGVATIITAIAGAGSGAELWKVESEIRSLEEERVRLGQMLVSGSSLTKIQEDSDELGLAKPQAMLYLNDEVVVAKLP